MLDSQGRFHQACDAGCSLGVPNDSLDATDVQRIFVGCALPVAKEGRGDGFSFLGVASRGSSSYKNTKSSHQYKRSPGSALHV